MYVCMYMYVYVCMYYVCMYVYVYACIHVCTCMYMYVYVYVYMYVYVYVPDCIHVWMHVGHMYIHVRM